MKDLERLKKGILDDLRRHEAGALQHNNSEAEIAYIMAQMTVKEHFQRHELRVQAAIDFKPAGRG